LEEREAFSHPTSIIVKKRPIHQRINWHNRIIGREKAQLNRHRNCSFGFAAMSSLSQLTYEARASKHRNPLARRLFTIASEKKTNVVVSADVTTSKELLDLAECTYLPTCLVLLHPQILTDSCWQTGLGPYMVVLKTHIDILSDLTPSTLTELKFLSQKHNFLLFEDRKFIDIGNTVQKQYHGGALQISDWAHIVNCSVLAGSGIVDALAKTAAEPEFQAKYGGSQEGRALLILAEMTSKGSLATGEYTKLSVDLARKHPDFVLGFVATRSLGEVEAESAKDENEDFVVFTTGVNLASKGDALGQQYQTPQSAITRGADFIISGRGIYAAPDPVAAIREYQQCGWDVYLKRTGQA
jgi:orotidine-5'-phosphate decarboxylase